MDVNEDPSPGQPRGNQALVIRSAAITLVGSALGGALSILNEVLAARLLGVEHYGLYATAMTVARVGEAISVFGMQVAIFHYLPVYRKQEANGLVAGTVYASALLPLLLGLSYLAIIIAIAPWLGHRVFNSEDVVLFIRLLAVAVPFMAGSEVLGSITRGFGWAKYYVLIRNLTPPVVFLASLAVMATAHAPAIWIAAGVLGAYALACVVGGSMIVRIAGHELWPVRPAFAFRTLYGYAAGVMVNNALYLVFAVAGLFTIGFFHGSASLGIYRACLQIVLPFEMIVLAFHAAMGPIYPVLARENRVAELEDAYGMSLRWMTVLHVPMGVALAWNRQELLAIMGPQFTDGATALAILAVGFSLCMCYGTGAYLLMLSGRRAIETKNAAVGALLNVVLAVALVPAFGLAGAAISTVAGFALVNTLRIWEIRRLVGLRTFTSPFLRVLAVSLISATASFALLQAGGLLQGASPIALGVRIAVMSLIQAAALWWLGLMPRDRDMVAGLWRSVTATVSSRSQA